MIPVQVRLALGIAALILAFTTGWMVKGWQTDARELQAYQDAVAKGNAMGAQLEAALAKLEANKFVIKSEVRHETEKQIYRDCTLSADGIRLFNQSALGNTGEP